MVHLKMKVEPPMIPRDYLIEDDILEIGTIAFGNKDDLIDWFKSMRPSAARTCSNYNCCNGLT